MDSRRAESFSDGVFAVAITVLIFNLLPIATPQVSYKLLGQHWPQYVAYVVSFLTIGILWLNHHAMLSRVSRVDRNTLVINMFLLMGVVAVPFPTALIADSLGPGGSPGAARVATVIYGLVLIAISIAYAALWVYMAARQDSLAAVAEVVPPAQALKRFAAAPVGYVAGTLIAALASPPAALTIYGVIAVYYLFARLPEIGEETAAVQEPATPG